MFKPCAVIPVYNHGGPLPQVVTALRALQLPCILVDEQGHYQEAQSVGWDAENYATDLALQELAQQARQAHANWQAGHASVLPYLMYRYRMD